MTLRPATIAAWLISLMVSACIAQTNPVTPAATPSKPPVRDNAAISLLIRSLAAMSSGSSAEMRDFRITGKATLWAGHESNAPLEAKGRGLDGLRLQISLPEDEFIWSVTSTKAEARAQ